MRVTPSTYYVCLNRPFLVLGVEHELFYLFLCFSLLIAFSARLTWHMDIVAVVVFCLLTAIGNLISRFDPQMVLIYRRHIQYKKYYAASPGLHSEVPLVKPSVPVYVGKEGLET